MKLYIDNNNFLMKPKNDLIFKRLFGDERNKDLLISLLKAILKTDIKDVKLMNTALNIDTIGSKKGILDVRATIDNDVKINIEIQVLRIPHMPERSLFYWSKMYIDQIASGEEYGKLKKTIAINILDFDCLNVSKYHNSFHLREDSENFILSDVLEIHFLELKKLSEKSDVLAQWMNFIKGDSVEMLNEMAKANKDIEKAMQLLETMSHNPEIKAQYLAREIELHDEATRIAEKFAEGKAEGRAEGKAEGIAEGKAEGRAEGRAEGKSEGKAELLIKLLAKKFKYLPDDYMDRIRKLPEETLEIIGINIFDLNSVEDLNQYL